MSLDLSTAISALRWIIPLAAKEGENLLQVPDDVRRVARELEATLIFLEDMDGRRLKDQNSRSLSYFVEKMRSLAFRSEDVIDTYLANFEPKIDKTNFFMKFFCICINAYPIHTMAEEIKAIQQEMEEQRRNFDFRALVGGQEWSSSSSNDQGMSENHQPWIALDSKEKFVVGREDDIKKLVHELLEGSHFVVAIVGVGGMGKTTLARKLHTDPRALEHFESKRAMITVSQEWNVEFMLREIIRQTIGEDVRKLIKPQLVDKLRSFLQKRRYLIILDDIWEKEAWADIADAFPKNGRGKIVITSRNMEECSSIHPGCFIHEPLSLGLNERYDLLYEIALGWRLEPDRKQFEDLAREMSKRCSGIPLAVVSLAGTLSTKNTLHQWRSVRDSLATTILNGERLGNHGGVVNDILALSYHDLRSRLKSCLLYLAVFPEDYVIEAESVIRMWIAEDLIRDSDCQSNQERLEDVGFRFLDEFYNRCLLIILRRDYEGKVERFQLHDLLRDFCIEKSKNVGFFEVIHTLDVQEAQATTSSARRIILLPSNNRTDGLQKWHSKIGLPIIRKIEGGATTGVGDFDVGVADKPALRSIIHVAEAPSNAIKMYIRGEGYNDQLSYGLKIIAQDFRLLKVLCLCGVRGLFLLDQISDLKLLKYFQVMHCVVTGGTDLSKAISNLENLSTFAFCVPGYYVRLSKIFFARMKFLRNLRIDAQIVGNEYCIMENLRNLQTLEINCIGLSTSRVLGHLPQLTSLRRLILSTVVHEEILEFVYQCSSFDSLEELCLDCTFDLKIDLQKIVTNFSKLRKLNLWGPIKEEEHSDMSIQFPQNLLWLRLYDSGLKRPEYMGAITQLSSLKYIDLHGAYEGKQLLLKHNSFPLLEELHIHSTYIKEWRIEARQAVSGSAILLPCLRKIKAVMEKLESLPQELQYVSTLMELNVVGSEVLHKKLEKIQGEDFHIIRHIPSVLVGKCD